MRPATISAMGTGRLTSAGARRRAGVGTASRAGAGSARDRLALRIARLRFGPAARVDFYLNFAFVLDRDLMLQQALERLLEMERDLPHGLLGRPLVRIIPVWIDALRTGRSLSDVIVDWVSPHEATSFAASARVGVSASQLRHLADDLRRLTALAGTMRRASWPVVFTLMVVWGCFAASHWYMFPLFEAEIGTGIRWTGLAAWLHAVSGTATTRVGPAFLLLAAAWPLLRLSLRSWAGEARSVADRFIPGFGLYRRATGMSWLLAMAALLEAGRTPTHALEALRPVASPYLCERIDAALSRADLSLGDALLSCGLAWPDIRIIHRIRLCLGGDNPAAEFRSLAAFELERLETAMRGLAETVAVAGYLFFSGFILFVILAQNDIVASLR
ncbi:MAG: hypothetical protein OXE86_05475 [Alphaproteobacteria bacterium]|nr:hypothetical protein [Alphaproteobacteria bacterium]